MARKRSDDDAPNVQYRVVSGCGGGPEPDDTFTEFTFHVKWDESAMRVEAFQEARKLRRDLKANPTKFPRVFVQRWEQEVHRPWVLDVSTEVDPCRPLPEGAVTRMPKGESLPQADHWSVKPRLV